MNSRQDQLRGIAYYLAFGMAVAPIVSIAASQILLGAAFLGLLISRARLRMPPVKLPLGLFMLGTVISLLFSQDPVAGLPQIRKFYVLLTLPVVYTAFRNLGQVRRLTAFWVLTASLAAALGLEQFGQKWLAAREMGAGFYRFYIAERITGFMSHWQTFGGELMLVFSLLVAAIFFLGLSRRLLLVALAAAALIAAGIVLGFTRNIWLGSFAAGCYLLWCWRRKLLLGVPVALVALVALGPASLRERVTSLVRPHGEVDSNQHRIVTFRTGWRMIIAHPLLGLGPEHVGIHFQEYVPKDIPRPLPEGWYGHLHNIYLQYAAERGIPTMLCLVWLLCRAILDFRRGLRRRPPPEVAWFLHGAIGCVIAIMTAGLFEYNLGDSEVLTLFLAVIAAGYSVLSSAEPEAEPRHV